MIYCIICIDDILYHMHRWYIVSYAAPGRIQYGQSHIITAVSHINWNQRLTEQYWTALSFSEIQKYCTAILYIQYCNTIFLIHICNAIFAMLYMQCCICNAVFEMLFFKYCICNAVFAMPYLQCCIWNNVFNIVFAMLFLQYCFCNVFAMLFSNTVFDMLHLQYCISNTVFAKLYLQRCTEICTEQFCTGTPFWHWINWQLILVIHSGDPLTAFLTFLIWLNWEGWNLSLDNASSDGDIWSV